MQDGHTGSEGSLIVKDAQQPLKEQIRVCSKKWKTDFQEVRSECLRQAVSDQKNKTKAQGGTRFREDIFGFGQDDLDTFEDKHQVTSVKETSKGMCVCMSNSERVRI